MLLKLLFPLMLYGCDPYEILGPPRDCLSPCGIGMFGSNKCYELQRAEAIALDAFNMTCNWNPYEKCQELRGTTIQIVGLMPKSCSEVNACVIMNSKAIYLRDTPGFESPGFYHEIAHILSRQISHEEWGRLGITAGIEAGWTGYRKEGI